VPDRRSVIELHRVADGRRRTDAVWIFVMTSDTFVLPGSRLPASTLFSASRSVKDAYQPSTIHDHEGADFAGGH
jgi:hypothetical protein